MPWLERSIVDERMRFVARLLEGEKMAVFCREFDISRRTGYNSSPGLLNEPLLKHTINFATADRHPHTLSRQF
jgi:hypothetical protein